MPALLNQITVLSERCSLPTVPATTSPLRWHKRCRFRTKVVVVATSDLQKRQLSLCDEQKNVVPQTTLTCSVAVHTKM